MRYPFWNLCAFILSTYGPYSEILPRHVAEWNLLSVCDSVLQGLDAYLAISFKKFSLDHTCPKKRIQKLDLKIWMCIRTGYMIYLYTSDACSCILPSLAGTLWPEGSGRLSWFPHWFRHQTGQGWVGILRWVESTQWLKVTWREMGCTKWR